MTKYEEYALWSIPSAFPPVIENKHQMADLKHDYQSMVGHLTTTLVAKLVAGLFPFNSPFFKLDPADTKLSSAAMGGLNKAVRRACSLLFRFANYSKLIELVTYLLITGNGLLYRDPASGRLVAYSPRTYITRRAWDGRVRDLVIREIALWQDIPQAYKEAAKQVYATPETEVTLWTHVQYGERLVVETVYVNDVQVFTQDHVLELCPYIPCVWRLMQNEHMGRGLIEENIGDVAKYSEQAHSLTLYQCESLRIRHMVAPTANVDFKQFEESECGELVQGDPDGISVYEAGDHQKMTVIQADQEHLELRLQRAFMYTGQFRDAERVTQEEVRQIVRAAENTFGGNYSQLAEVLQQALAHLQMQSVDPRLAATMRNGEAPAQIITGMAALTRSTIVQGWLDTAQELAAILPIVTQFMPLQDPYLITKQVMLGNGLDPEETEKDAEEVQTETESPTMLEDVQQQTLGAAPLPAPGELNV